MRDDKSRKHLLTLGFVMLFAMNLHSQSVKVKSATSQGWAGGICCIHGTNYNIHLQIIRNKHAVTLDTLWLEGYCKDLSVYNQKKIKQRDTVNIYIQESLRTDDSQFDPYNDINPNIEGYNENKKGVIIVYRIGTKKMSLNITPYIKELEYLAYP